MSDHGVRLLRAVRVRLTLTTATAPDHLSLAAQLPAGAYYYLMQSLRRMLPLLRNDTPEDRVRRNHGGGYSRY
jgi:hypothetical protein